MLSDVSVNKNTVANLSAMDFLICVIAIAIIAFIINKFCRKQRVRQPPQITVSRTNRLLETYGVRHINAIVDQFKSFEEVSQAIRKAGLESSNLIFGEHYYKMYSEI